MRGAFIDDAYIAYIERQHVSKQVVRSPSS